MKRTTIATAFLCTMFGLAACDDPITGPEDITGTYELSKVNGRPLPHRTFERRSGTPFTTGYSSSTVDITKRWITFYQDLSCITLTTQHIRNTRTYRNETKTGTVDCTYTLDGGDVSVAYTGVTYSGSISKSRLTLLQGEDTWVYEK
jgi:hypothetical protein